MASAASLMVPDRPSSTMPGMGFGALALKAVMVSSHHLDLTTIIVRNVKADYRLTNL
jgi:hypothetical protein